MNRRSKLLTTPLVLVGLAGAAGLTGAACGGAPRKGVAAPSGSASVRAALGATSAMAGSHWVPESIDGAENIQTMTDGTRRGLIGRLRVEETPAGAIHRAEELLPSRGSSSTRSPYGYGYQPPPAPQNVSSMKLPERLGGGYLFIGNSGGTQLWRATEYLGKLSPLVQLRSANAQIIAGPDRLIAYSQGTDRAQGVDPETGRLIPPLGLPVGPQVANVVFADAWRGAAFIDLQGVVVTHDAGANWHPVGISQQPRSIEVVGDNIQVSTHDATYTIDSAGRVARDANTVVTAAPYPGYPGYPGHPGAYPYPYPYPGYPYGPGGYQPTPPVAPTASATFEKGKRVPRKPFGAHPLKAAVESGWPLLDGTAVVLREGRLGKIRLEDGEVLASTPVLIKGEEDATCSAVRYGADVGFVCGSPLMGTSIYALTDPLGLNPVARFAKPRAVFPSGNGSLVVRGPCDLDASAAPPAVDQPRPYCVISPTGSRREIRTRGEAVERVVGLADGRIVVLIPPRLDAGPGQVTILPAGAGAASAIRLQLPEGETSEVLLQQGLWLDGVVESGEDEIAAWIEAAGIMLGVRISLKDGTITVGKQRDSAETLVSGLLAFSVTGNDSALESTDGGQSWQPLDLPALGQGKPNVGRICTVTGCMVPFDRGNWLRVGWGPPKNSNDLAAAPDVSPGRGDFVSTRAFGYRCALSRVDPAPKAPPEPKAAAEPTYGMGGYGYGRPMRYPEPAPEVSSWLPFWSAAAPAKPKGFNAEQRDIMGPSGEGKLASLYAWYPKTGAGAEIVKNARLLARFIDRFDPTGAVRSSSTSVPSWVDEERLKQALGLGEYGGTGFFSLPDPSAHANLIIGCNYSYRCDAYGVVEGRAIEMLPTPDGGSEFTQLNAPSGSAVRIDDAWYVARSLPGQVLVWKLSMSEAKLIARVPRVAQPLDNVKIVRRSRGRGLGLLASGLGVFGHSEHELFVLPLDPDSGAAGELLRLGPSDLNGVAPSHCSPEEDGWLVDTTLSLSVGIRDLSARVTQTEMRLRIDPGHACVESLAARLLDAGDAHPSARGGAHELHRNAPHPASSGRPAVAAGPASSSVLNIPLVAADYEGKRIVAMCSP